MKKQKIYHFNEFGICTNPDVQILWEKKPCYARISYAKVGDGWVYGTEFWMTVNVVGVYGLQGDGAWEGDIPKPLNECTKSAIQEAIRFFEEDGRKSRCTAVIAHLNTKLTEL